MDYTKEQVSHLFEYDPSEPFALRWRNPPKCSPRPLNGQIAGFWRPTKSGAANFQRYVRIAGKFRPVHRIVWLLHHDSEPSHDLGFRNGDPGDCRIENLLQNPRKPSPEELRKKRKANYQKWISKFTDEERLKMERSRNSMWRSKFSDEELADIYRRRALKRAYGITPEKYDEMHAEQNGLCAICRKPETMIRHGRPDNLCVDHCHSKHLTRGLLCNNCNNGLGRFGDDPLTLKSALDYIERWSLAEEKERANPFAVAAE